MIDFFFFKKKVKYNKLLFSFLSLLFKIKLINISFTCIIISFKRKTFSNLTQNLKIDLNYQALKKFLKAILKDLIFLLVLFF